MRIAARAKAAYEERRSRHLCVACGVKLPSLETWHSPRAWDKRKPVRCAPCKAKLLEATRICHSRDSIGRHERDDMSGDRCKCGLRLPCNDCIPTARDYAESRHWQEGGIE